MIARAADDLGTDHLRFECRGLVAWCTVDRSKARNALTPAMYQGLGRALRIVTDDTSLGALVITGAGDVFIPGGEMQSTLSQPGEPRLPSDVLPFNAFRNSRVPVVAAINGICQASGLLLAMLADIAVASERATFRAPELLRGFADMWFAAVLPAHVGVGRARELMMTGRIVDATEAHRIGLVERVVAHDELCDRADKAALELLENAPAARLAWRRAANTGYGLVDEMTFDGAPSSPEVDEGFAAFREKRPPTWSPRVAR